MWGDILFGYVKPVKGELLVKELELYRAFYCGLCRAMKKTVSPLFTPTLSYDFVFMALIRASLTYEKAETEKIRCSFHPFKKKLSVKANDSLIYTSDAALVLNYYKINDDIHDRDTSFLRKILLKPYALLLKSFLKKRRKKSAHIAPAEDFVKTRLAALSGLEKSKTANADLPSGEFGSLLGDILSYGIEGQNKLIAGTIGTNLGRYIYYIDACDDILKDHKNGSYNPFLEYYKTPEKVKENFDLIDTVLSLYINNIVTSLHFMDKSVYTGIIENIVKLGLGQEAFNIFGNKN